MELSYCDKVKVTSSRAPKGKRCHLISTATDIGNPPMYQYNKFCDTKADLFFIQNCAKVYVLEIEDIEYEYNDTM